jgi:hypothetical protein
LPIGQSKLTTAKTDFIAKQINCSTDDHVVPSTMKSFITNFYGGWFMVVVVLETYEPMRMLKSFPKHYSTLFYEEAST